jgi:hypothetical protein
MEVRGLYWDNLETPNELPGYAEEISLLSR